MTADQKTHYFSVTFTTLILGREDRPTICGIKGSRNTQDRRFKSLIKDIKARYKQRRPDYDIENEVRVYPTDVVEISEEEYNVRLDTVFSFTFN